MSIAREGFREIALATLVCHALAGAGIWAALTVSPWFWAIVPPLWAVWLFVIAFFRDPARTIPDEHGVMVSPADGKVTEVTRLDSYDGIDGVGRIDGPAIRISIFLSVFNVHVNRVPCAGRVVRTKYQPGEFLDARHPECGIRNEANTVVIEPDGVDAGARKDLRTSDSHTSGGPVIVRQIAGLIARRIICQVAEGDLVERGQRLGLIKFGSRTELIVPASSGLAPAVRVGDNVRGGSTVLLRTAARHHGGASIESSIASTSVDALTASSP